MGRHPARLADMRAPTVAKNLSGWSRVPAAQCDVASVDSWDLLDAWDLSSRPCIARGNGRSYGDASFTSEGTTLSITPRNHFLELDTERGLLRAEAGVT